jgi:hypothetical protein
MNALIRNLSLAILLAIGNAGALAAETAPAGHVMLLTGHGSALSADGGAIRELRKDDAVFTGEMISAANNSYVNLRFTDDSFILLRPNTRMLVEAYAYPPAAEAPKPAASATTPAPRTSKPVAAANGAGSTPTRRSGFFRLLKGGFRAVSGLIGKVDRDEYRVSTPVATIGIRGTDYYVYQCDAACENDPVIAELVGNGKLPPNIAGGTLVGVYKGAVLVQSLTGKSTLVEAGQYLLTLADGSQYLLPIEPLFLRVTPFPDPTTFCAVDG